MKADVRALRKRLTDIDQHLDEGDLADWALVHALVQLDWYRRQMVRTRIRYVTAESAALLLASAATVLAALSAPAWLTAVVAATVTFLAGLRRVVSWHDDWVAAAEARSAATALVSQYRLLDPAARTPDVRKELVSSIDALVLEETRGWGRRRREKDTARGENP